MLTRSPVFQLLPAALAFLLVLGQATLRGGETVAAAPGNTGQFETGNGVQALSPWGNPGGWGVARGVEGRARGGVGVGLPASLGPVTAMNGEGVFIAIHDVYIKPSMKDYLQGNVPRLIALRRILEMVPAAGAVEKAAELCRSWN